MSTVTYMRHKLFNLLLLPVATILLIISTACEPIETNTSTNTGTPTTNNAFSLDSIIGNQSNEQDLLNSNITDLGIVDITTFPGYQGLKQAEMDALRDDIVPELQAVVADALFINGCHPWVTSYKDCGWGMYDGEGNNANPIPGTALRNAESAQWKHSIWMSNEAFYQKIYDPVYIINHEAVHAWIHHVLEPCGLAEAAIEEFYSGRFDHREAFAAEEELTDAITVYLLGDDTKAIYFEGTLTSDQKSYIANLFATC